jgi:hypothetical protein
MISLELLLDLLFPYYDDEYLVWSLVCKKWHHELSKRTQRFTKMQSVIFDTPFFLWSRILDQNPSVCKLLCKYELKDQIEQTFKLYPAYINSYPYLMVAIENRQFEFATWLSTKFRLRYSGRGEFLIRQKQIELYKLVTTSVDSSDVAAMIHTKNIDLFTQFAKEGRFTSSGYWLRQLFAEKNWIEYIVVVEKYLLSNAHDGKEIGLAAIHRQNIPALEYLYMKKIGIHPDLRSLAASESQFFEICIWLQQKGYP